MRPITIDPNNVQASLLEIQRASQENDPVQIAQNISFDAPFSSPTTTLNTTAPDLGNCVAVLATLIDFLQKGGPNRTT